MNYKKKTYERGKKDYSVIKARKQGNIKLIRSVILYSLQCGKPKNEGQCDEGDRMREHESRKKVRYRSLNNRKNVRIIGSWCVTSSLYAVSSKRT